ncbi:MAG TPA: lysylphosphatidylglycerol synthase domain-containing protein [Steroidobacteraceae bacterium]
MNLRLIIIAILGIALGLYLVSYVGFGAVLAAAAAVGWSGFAILCTYSLGLFVVLGLAWFVLLPDTGAKLRVFIQARMIRDAAADVLPFSQLGGLIVGARAAVLSDVSPPLAFASLVVDVTTEMLAQIAYIALGLVFLSTRVPKSDAIASLTHLGLIALALGVIGGAAFLALQRYGHRVTGRLIARLLRGSGAATEAVTATFDAIYRRRARIVLSTSVHLVGWIASAMGAWIAFRLIGARLDLPSVIALEALVCAARSAGSLVPNALGVQEAAYAVLAPLFGVGAEFGLAVSLLKRARDIAIGVPILLLWQAAEGRRALAAKAGR